MIAGLKTYLLGIVAAAMVVAILTAFLQEDSLRKAVRLVGGILLLLAAVGPVVRMDLDAFGKYLSALSIEADELRTGIAVESKDVMAAIIREKTETYILDKAKQLGAEVAVSVTTTADADYPYPESAEIRGVLTEVQRNSLAMTMELELAIPRERQAFLPP